MTSENSSLRIGVLALQGAFLEHRRMLERLGARTFEIRQRKDLDFPMDGIVLPGGESTVQGKLLRSLELFEPLRENIRLGLPVLGTCAGAILLAERIEGASEAHLGTLPMTVRRNAYGRQLGSFYTEGKIENVGDAFPMTFIRAPVIEGVEKGVRVLASVGGRIVAVQFKRELAVTFHPELSLDARLHAYFLSLCRDFNSA